MISVFTIADSSIYIQKFSFFHYHNGTTGTLLETGYIGSCWVNLRMISAAFFQEAIAAVSCQDDMAELFSRQSAIL